MVTIQQHGNPPPNNYQIIDYWVMVQGAETELWRIRSYAMGVLGGGGGAV